MSFEVEQKFRVEDAAQIPRALVEMGLDLGPAVEQVDEYFAHPARDFAETDEALRIRRVGEANFITYKGPKVDATTKTRREIEFELPAAEVGFHACESLLTALGFSLVARVAKQRRRAVIDHGGHSVEIALDEIDELGSFVELEISVVSEAEIDAARRVVAQLAERLGLAASERRSYLELLLAHRSGA